LTFRRLNAVSCSRFTEHIATMSKLTEYLLDLAADPDRCALFKANPASEPGYAELNDAEKAAVASRDPEQIATAIADADVDPESVVLFHWLSAIFGEAKL
jgi:hypothetical protein